MPPRGCILCEVCRGKQSTTTPLSLTISSSCRLLLSAECPSTIRRTCDSFMAIYNFKNFVSHTRNNSAVIRPEERIYTSLLSAKQVQILVFFHSWKDNYWRHVYLSCKYANLHCYCFSQFWRCYFSNLPLSLKCYYLWLTLGLTDKPVSLQLNFCQQSVCAYL